MLQEADFKRYSIRRLYNRPSSRRCCRLLVSRAFAGTRSGGECVDGLCRHMCLGLRTLFLTRYSRFPTRILLLLFFNPGLLPTAVLAFTTELVTVVQTAFKLKR